MEGSLNKNGWDETFPKQGIAEHVSSNLGEWCLVSGPQNTYINRGQSQPEPRRNTRQMKSNIGRDSWKAIEILNCKECNSKRAINIRYILDNEKLLVAWHTPTRDNTIPHFHTIFLKDASRCPNSYAGVCQVSYISHPLFRLHYCSRHFSRLRESELIYTQRYN
jgi:hypothetical protein